MGKVHTHYDNLKVSRMAPQEVIRAAYKALSQKYHPDKNPGDEKAARIMAIVNGAYTTLADPQRRREHDEWIAAEEWEVDWVESTRHEDHRGDRGRPDTDHWQAETMDSAPRKRKTMARWRWGGALLGCLVVGWVGGAVTSEPHWLEKAWGGKAPPGISQARAGAQEAGHEARDSLAPGERSGLSDHPGGIKVVALSQVVLPNGDCDNNDAGSQAQTGLAPNGEPWPGKSGYLDGFSVGNRGEDMQLMVDNANNESAVFIKVYDVDRRANVRYAYVQAHDRYMVDKLANGKYEIRYQNLDSNAACADSAPANPRRAAAEIRPSSLL